MKRIGKFIAGRKTFIVLAAFLLLIPSALGFIATKVNYDILSYLPDSLETVAGQDIMVDDDAYSKELETKMHQTIKKVSNDFENLKYNTAIAAMMALINDFYKNNTVTKDEFKTLITLLNPVAPHMTEELWEIMGFEGRLYQTAWPEYDEAKTVENTVEIAVQINGKTKATISIAKDEAKDAVIAKAKEAIAGKLTGTVVKEIYVPGRIVNIVQK